jgi:hypothetical protein
MVGGERGKESERERERERERRRMTGRVVERGGKGREQE